ncbi:hypothetical protein EV182_006837, partial [Spiromyces aspiralis]
MNNQQPSAETNPRTTSGLDEILRALSELSGRLDANNEQMAALEGHLTERLDANNNRIEGCLNMIKNHVRTLDDRICNLDNHVHEVESHQQAFPPGIATTSCALVTTPPARTQTTVANPPPMHTPLPVPHQAAVMPPTTPMEADNDADTSNDAPDDDSDHRLQFLEELHAELTANRAIDPAVPCPLPEARVTIPTTTDQAFFRRQPPLPDTTAQIVDEEISELRDLGFIQPAPVGTKYNSMIFLVPKRDATGRMALKRP